MFEQLANIGELIGGLGTLAALVYLGAQVRHSNRIARATSRQQLLDTFYDRAWESGTDPRLAKVIAGGVMNWDGLSNQDKTTFHNMMATWLANIENGLALQKDGLVEDATVRFIARAMANCVNAPGGAAVVVCRQARRVRRSRSRFVRRRHSRRSGVRDGRLRAGVPVLGRAGR